MNSGKLQRETSFRFYDFYKCNYELKIHTYMQAYTCQLDNIGCYSRSTRKKKNVENSAPDKIKPCEGKNLQSKTNGQYRQLGSPCLGVGQVML